MTLYISFLQDTIYKVISNYPAANPVSYLIVYCYIVLCINSGLDGASKFGNVVTNYYLAARRYNLTAARKFYRKLYDSMVFDAVRVGFTKIMAACPASGGKSIKHAVRVIIG